VSNIQQNIIIAKSYNGVYAYIYRMHGYRRDKNDGEKTSKTKFKIHIYIMFIVQNLTNRNYVGRWSLRLYH